MTLNSISTCNRIWFHIIYALAWVFLWGYAFFIAPTVYKMLADVGQNAWFLSRLPHYTLFFGNILSVVCLYINRRNISKINSNTGGSPLHSIMALSIAYLIPVIEFIGDASMIIQTVVSIPFKH